MVRCSSLVLDTPGKLGKIIYGMNRSLGTIPLTIKVRTGVKDGKNTTHKLMSRLPQWPVGAMTASSTCVTMYKKAC